MVDEKGRCEADRANLTGPHLGPTEWGIVRAAWGHTLLEWNVQSRPYKRLLLGRERETERKREEYAKVRNPKGLLKK